MAAKKKVVKKAAAKKAPVQKAAAKKTVAKKAPAKTAATKKTVAKKAPAPTAAKTAPAKKAPAAPPAAPAENAPAGSGMPAVGQAAPDFTIANENDTPVTLSALRGKKVVLYFYPRDNTPGCTIEARDFSTLLPEFAAKNAVVYGISTDSAASHRKFHATCELSVPLLADPERVAHAAFGAWGMKSLYGRQFEGTIRSTFLIDEQGVVRRVWPKVKVEDHALDVLNAL